MILYRPVGLQELELIYDSGMKAFPARLPQQPIFYPVLQLEYARQTALDWNAKSGQLAGYVTQFKVEEEYIARFETHLVGGSQYEEYWIPAEEMEEFNRHITGHIKVVEAYFGDGFQGFVPDQFGLQGKHAVEQFTLLTNSYIYKRMDFYLEIKRNHKAVFLNYPFWLSYDFQNPGLKEKVIAAIREGWLNSFPKTPLPQPVPAEVKDPPEAELEPRASEEPAKEEPPPARHTGSPPSERPVRKDVVNPKRTGSNSVANPVPQKPPDNKTGPRFRASPAQGETPPRPRVPRFLVPARRETPPPKQNDPQPSMTPVSPGHAPGRQVESHFAEGIRLANSGRVQEAIEALSRAVEKNPGHVIAQTSLGVAYHRAGEEDRALSCYEAALKLDPRDAEAHYFRANILYGRGNVREAIAEYAAAIGQKPELIAAHHAPIPEDRLTDYSPVPAGIPRIARPAQRILDLNRSLESNPSQAQLFKERAAEYSRLENYEQAIADYNSFLAIQPDDAGVLHLRGQAYEQAGQHERAHRDYQQAVAADPQLSNLYMNRGVELGKMGNFRQSIAILTEGIRLAPANPDGYFNRGMTYVQLGEFENAIQDLSQVIRLAPADEAAYYWRGISYEEAGRLSEAISDYRQFLTLSQDEPARQEVEHKLRQWNAGRPDQAQGQRNVPSDRQKARDAQPEKPDHELDVYDLLTALGQRALDSTWLASGFDCEGEKAEDLYALGDQERPIAGDDLLAITARIRRTTAGDLQAFDAGAESPWIFIRAWKGEGFYIETNDPKSRQRLESRFSVEVVEGVAPPYVGLFVRI